MQAIHREEQVMPEDKSQDVEGRRARTDEDEPDVEAHRRARTETGEDDSADVEAHRFKVNPLDEDEEDGEGIRARRPSGL
jgi:hypothetical protein